MLQLTSDSADRVGLKTPNGHVHRCKGVYRASRCRRIATRAQGGLSSKRGGGGRYFGSQKIRGWTSERKRPSGQAPGSWYAAKLAKTLPNSRDRDQGRYSSYAQHVKGRMVTAQPVAIAEGSSTKNSGEIGAYRGSQVTVFLPGGSGTPLGGSQGPCTIIAVNHELSPIRNSSRSDAEVQKTRTTRDKTDPRDGTG